MISYMDINIKIQIYIDMLDIIKLCFSLHDKQNKLLKNDTIQNLYCGVFG